MSDLGRGTSETNEAAGEGDALAPGASSRADARDPATTRAIVAPPQASATPEATRFGVLRLFLTALGYFTRVPIPAWVGYSPAQLGAATRYFPAVGIFVGALVAAVSVALGHVWQASVAIALGMVASVLLTGAFHEDGLADSVDAFGGGFTRERTLAIMHDSRIGTYGAVALVLALLLKWQLLTTVQARFGWSGFAVVTIGAHAASRCLAISLLRALNYVRAEGKAKPVAQRLTLGSLLFGVACSVPWWIWPDWRAGATAVVVLWVLRVCLVRYLRKRLGGYTGDTLGFSQQLAELSLYLTVCAWM